MPFCMAGAIQTFLFLLSMSVHICACPLGYPCLFLSCIPIVHSYRLCCLLFPSCSVLQFFDGWQILINSLSYSSVLVLLLSIWLPVMCAPSAPVFVWFLLRFCRSFLQVLCRSALCHIYLLVIHLI